MNYGYDNFYTFDVYVLAGFRLKWFYNNDNVETQQQFSSEEITRQFVRKYQKCLDTIAVADIF